MCLRYVKHALSKLGATKCAPAGALFPPKIHLLFSINREPLFLCLKYTKYVLSKLCATKCAPAGAFSPPKIHLLYSINRDYMFLYLRYIKALAGDSGCRLWLQPPAGMANLRGGSATPTLGDSGNYEPKPPEPLQLKAVWGTTENTPSLAS